jgi:hypothetical protein
MSATKGAEEVPNNFDEEMGSANTLPIRDLVPELSTRRLQIQTWDTMSRTDAVCKVSLNAAKVPILGADIYIDPMGDDQNAVDVGEFVSWNLFEAMSVPWHVTLVKVLKMYQHGSSILEPVYENREWSPSRKMANRRMYTTIRKLGYRPALTIEKIETDDNGGPVEIVQRALDKNNKAKEVRIPIEKAIIFSMGDSDDLMGESILRTAYQHWFYKTHMYKVDAIQKERHGIGIPKGKLQPGYTSEDKRILSQLLRNIRTNERAYMTLPPGYDVEMMKLEGQLVNVLESANHHDVLILLNVMAEFMMLGLETSGGGRATSGAQLDLFYKSEWFIANFVCACFNQWLIPKLVRYNFETDVIPQMKVRNIGQSRDLQQFAAALSNMVSENIITPDTETEDWARRVFDAPRKKEARPSFEQLNGKVQNPGQDKVGQNGGQGNSGKAPTEA